jgi:hypothetical protein
VWRGEVEALNTQDLPAPEVLCHYTGFAGLEGILSSNQLWFTYAKTLNDSLEQKYGRTLITEHLRTRLPSGKEREAVEAGVNHPYRFFVSCFCESSSLLSMWRSYASLGGGYCLEFETSALQESKFSSSVNPVLWKMSYDSALPASARAILDKVAAFAQKDIDHARVAGAVLSIFP